MKVTIRTIAQLAGVSVPTVSRVLNSPELVKQETRQRVFDVMEEHDYFPDERARGLRSNNARIIGVITPRIRDFFFGLLYQGIYEAAAAAGLQVLTFDADLDEGRLLEGLTTLKRQQCDGIIFSSAFVGDVYGQHIKRLGIPVVLVLTESDSRDLPAYKVDDVNAAFDAVAYLVARGHRKIGMISGPVTDPIAGSSRLEGYERALAHYQLSCSPEQVAYGNFRYEHGWTAMDQLFQARAQTGITAVFCASDEMALGAMRCVYDHGLSVPEDISIIGFDNISVSDMVTTKLTTIAQPFEQIGYEAVQSLLTAFRRQGKHLLSETCYLQHRIIVRESVRAITYDSS